MKEEIKPVAATEQMAATGESCLNHRISFTVSEF